MTSVGCAETEPARDHLEFRYKILFRASLKSFRTMNAQSLVASPRVWVWEQKKWRKIDGNLLVHLAAHWTQCEVEFLCAMQASCRNLTYTRLNRVTVWNKYLILVRQTQWIFTRERRHQQQQQKLEKSALAFAQRKFRWRNQRNRDECISHIFNRKHVQRWYPLHHRHQYAVRSSSSSHTHTHRVLSVSLVSVTPHRRALDQSIRGLLTGANKHIYFCKLSSS